MKWKAHQMEILQLKIIKFTVPMIISISEDKNLRIWKIDLENHKECKLISKINLSFQAMEDWSQNFKDGTSKSTKTCCDGRKPLPWKEYNRGIEWIESNDKAFEQAKKEKSLVMLFHLVGDLDKGGC